MTAGLGLAAERRHLHYQKMLDGKSQGQQKQTQVIGERVITRQHSNDHAQGESQIELRQIFEFPFAGCEKD